MTMGNERFLKLTLTMTLLDASNIYLPFQCISGGTRRIVNLNPEKILADILLKVSVCLIA